MKIALDISCVTPTQTGIGHTCFELAKQMVLHEEHEFVLFFNSLRQPFPYCPEFRRNNVKIVRHYYPGPLLLLMWKYLNFPKIESLLEHRVDSFVSFSQFVPPFKDVNVVTMVHDLDYMSGEPDDHSFWGGRYLRWIADTRLREISLILANSQQTAIAVQNLIDHVPVSVVPLAVDEPFFTMKECYISAIRSKYLLPGNFVLFVGNKNKRKQLDLLLTSFDNFREKNRVENVQLVFLGPNDGFPDDNVARLWQQLKSAGILLELGYVPRADLPYIYRMAGLYLMTSKMEGFGLPVLEALTAGTPVVCPANVACLDYVNEDACVKVYDEETVDCIASAMEHAWFCKDKAMSDARAGGKRHSWRTAADIIMSAMSKMMVLLLILYTSSVYAANPMPMISVNKDKSIGKRIESVLYPFQFGKTYKCMQEPNGDYSHSDAWNLYAYDFEMAEREPVCSVAYGRVVLIEQDYKEGGVNKALSSKANRIVIDHGNNVFSKYLHLYPNSAFVETGDFVKPGQKIALSGNTGYSSAPHLHFQMQNMIGKSLPVQFLNVTDSKLKSPKRGSECTAVPVPEKNETNFSDSILPRSLFAASGVSLDSANDVVLGDFLKRENLKISGKICYQSRIYKNVALVFCNPKTQEILESITVPIQSDSSFVLEIKSEVLDSVRKSGHICLLGIAPVDATGRFQCRETLKIQL